MGLLERDDDVRRIAGAVERARLRGGGFVVVRGPAGVGTTAAVAEALRPLGATIARENGRIPDAATAAVWWIDDAQRLDVVLDAAAAIDRVVVLSGRGTLGAACAAAVRIAARRDPDGVIELRALEDASALEVAVALARADRAPDEATARAASAASAGRLRLLAAVLADAPRPLAPGTLPSVAVRLAVEDLLADLGARELDVLETVALCAPVARIAVLEKATGADGAELDAALAALGAADLVAVGSDGVRIAVPLVGEVVTAGLGAARREARECAIAAALDGMEGVDPREIAPHVRAVAGRLPREVSVRVLLAAGRRYADEFDHAGARVEFDALAELLQAAIEAGAAGERTRLFDALLGLATAHYETGALDSAEAAYRRALALADAVMPARLHDLEMIHTYMRADRGEPADRPRDPPEAEVTVHGAVLRLFLADRSGDAAELDAVCAGLVAFDGDRATPLERGAAALGRSIRLSVAGDPAAARAEAEAALRMAGDVSATLFGGIQRELIRLCTLQGDLDEARRHAAAGSAIDGRVPRVIVAARLIHTASVALLQGAFAEAAALADDALAMVRVTPIPRAIVRCAGWVAVISAMRGDLARARTLVAEASRHIVPGGNLRADAILDIARLQLALREDAPVPARIRLDLERIEGPSRLLLPLLLARLGLARSDAGSVQRALAMLAAEPSSPPAAALAQRIRALALVSTRTRHGAIPLLKDSADALGGMGFATLAAETRLEWAELAAERGDTSMRAGIADLVAHFDERRIDDWADRARRLARAMGVRVGGRRGGVGELTRRESEVVELVIAGMSNADVARRLYLSERTVETHLRHVYRRLGVDSRIGLIAKVAAEASGSATDG